MRSPSYLISARILFGHRFHASSTDLHTLQMRKQKQKPFPNNKTQKYSSSHSTSVNEVPCEHWLDRDHDIDAETHLSHKRRLTLRTLLACGATQSRGWRSAIQFFLFILACLVNDRFQVVR